MKLAAGTRLGPYEIEHAIGAGGMGVVYRADDSRVGRKVAIKVLPSATGEHFRRFEREARTIGALNHPNLLTLYDVGEHDGTPFLVTEMLEGESLRARLARGPMRLREAIHIAADVARGLAAAHDAGVVHRDVKPDNIFITTENRTKILDFGIAKLRRSTVEMEAVSGDIAHEPTITPTTADTGVIIGTPGYMAPEQLDGGKVDERTDIFGLGVVLYEMISGRRAFAAESAVEESYAILKLTPDPPKGATKALARVVLRCLEKRPDARFQSATDLAFALDELDASTDPVARISKLRITDPHGLPTVRDVARPPPLSPWTWIAIAATVGALGIVSGLLLGRVTAPVRATGLAPRWPTVVEGGVPYKRVTYHAQTYWNARLAPDGASVLYTANREGKDQVLRAQLATPSMLATGVPGRLLDISARGELAVVNDEVGTAGGTLTRVVEGAGPRAVADRVTAATWMPDDTLAIIRGELVLEFPIGKPLVSRTSGRIGILRASPDGTRFAYTDHPASNDTQGKVIVIDRSGVQLVASSDQIGVEGMAWSPDGREVWFSNGPTIFGLTLDGKERVVLRGIVRNQLIDVRAGKILVAPSDNRLKMFTGPRGGPYRDVGWFDSSEVEGVSKDGQTIAFVEAGGTGQTPAGYATFLRRADQPAALLANGYRCALAPDAAAAYMIASPTKLVRLPTGIGTATTIPIAPIAELDIGDHVAIDWSGRYLVVRGAEAGKPMKLWRIDLQQPSVVPIEGATADDRHPISPGGQTLAIARPEGGVSLVPVAGGAPRTLEGSVGEQPIGFHADGGTLFTMRLVAETIVVDRIDLATGQRAGWSQITPEQRPAYYTVVLSADGEVVTYSTNSDSTDLYVLAPPAAR